MSERNNQIWAIDLDTLWFTKSTTKDNPWQSPICNGFFFGGEGLILCSNIRKILVWLNSLNIPSFNLCLLSLVTAASTLNFRGLAFQWYEPNKSQQWNSRPIYWEFHHPNWRTHIFFREVGLNHQPDIISYYSHIPTRYSPSIALLLPAGRPSGTAKTTWDPQSLPALGADLPPGQEPRRSRCRGGASTGDASDVWQGRVFFYGFTIDHCPKAGRNMIF